MVDASFTPTQCFYGFSLGGVGYYGNVTYDGNTAVTTGWTSIFGGSADFNFKTFVNAAAVPEPATWAMMIAGFGALGGAMRRCDRQRGIVRTQQI